jgi:TolB-like protein/Flp pilus assembly protein TadD
MSQVEPRVSATDEPSASVVRTQLGRILSSELFSRSDRLSAFLNFIVERTLSGEGETLKEQVIAIELYGKGPDFNTAGDPIVRVDARRLRDKLREYYASAPHDDVLISVPKGSYTPAFRVNPLSAAPPGGNTSPAMHAVQRLAVLPFVNLTGDPNRDYLADGLTDETIATLGQIDPIGLVVIGRTSMMGYRRTTKSLADIGRELDADYLVESSIRTEYDRLRVTTGLVRARDQVQVWSGSYERDLMGVLELQKELSAGIAEQIRSWLSPQRSVAFGRRQTTNPRAYDCYLRGRFAQRQRTAASNATAILLFEEATAVDPSFALAWCALADIHASSGINGDGEPAAIAPRARDAATRAVVAGPQLAEAQIAVAQVRFWFDWDWAAAEASLRRAIALDPGNAHAQRMLGFVCSNIGRHADALAASQRSVDQDPLNAINYAGASEVAFRHRDYDAAVIQAERSLDLDSQFWIGYMLAAQAYEQLGRYDRALERLTNARHLSGNNSKAISLRGYILARTGRIHEARAALEDLAPNTAATYVPPYATALIHAGLGDRDATFEWLERACAVRDIHLVLLRIDPKWDPYRGDPRLESLLARCAFT